MHCETPFYVLRLPFNSIFPGLYVDIIVRTSTGAIYFVHIGSFLSATVIES